MVSAKGKILTRYKRLGMMTLLGQHGQVQDYHRGIDLIKYSADNADENASQGAYVGTCGIRHGVRTDWTRSTACYWRMICPKSPYHQASSPKMTAMH